MSSSHSMEVFPRFSPTTCGSFVRRSKRRSTLSSVACDTWRRWDFPAETLGGSNLGGDGSVNENWSNVILCYKRWNDSETLHIIYSILLYWHPAYYAHGIIDIIYYRSLWFVLELSNSLPLFFCQDSKTRVSLMDVRNRVGFILVNSWSVCQKKNGFITSKINLRSHQPASTLS